MRVYSVIIGYSWVFLRATKELCFDETMTEKEQVLEI